MRKSILFNLVLLFTLLPLLSESQPFTFDSSTSFGGKNNAGGGTKSTVDPNGNIYVIGEFQGTRSFGTTQLTATGISDIFIAMFNSAGVCQWAVSGGSIGGYSGAGGIAYSGGALYATGTFTGQFSINQNSVMSSGQTDIFIGQFDPSSGYSTYLVKAGGPNGDSGAGICSEAGGGFYVTGLFTGSATFGTTTISTGGLTNTNAFIAKYTAFGSCTWVQQGGNSAAPDAAYAIEELPNTNVVITGVFDGPAVFGSITLTPLLAQDIFVVAYNNAGTVLWAKKGSSKGGDIPNSIQSDINNNIFLTGTVGDTAYFDGTMVPGNGIGTFFLCKYNSAGVIQWARRATSPSANSGIEMATDTSGSCYIVGSCGLANFSGTVITGAPGFVAKYSTAGNLTWITRIPAPNYNTFFSVVLPPGGGGYCHLIGEYINTITIGSTTLTAAYQNQPELFITRLGGGTVGLSENTSSATFTTYPNPVTSQLHVTATNLNDLIVSVDVLSIDGKLVSSTPVGVENNSAEWSLDLSQLPAGHYVVNVNTSARVMSGRVVKL